MIYTTKVVGKGTGTIGITIPKQIIKLTNIQKGDSIQVQVLKIMPIQINQQEKITLAEKQNSKNKTSFGTKNSEKTQDTEKTQSPTGLFQPVSCVPNPQKQNKKKWKLN